MYPGFESDLSKGFGFNNNNNSNQGNSGVNPAFLAQGMGGFFGGNQGNQGNNLHSLTNGTVVFISQNGNYLGGINN